MSYEASRTKQQLVLQPKGKPLYNNGNSFGLKMLERMGWKKGSGLGKDQQGNLEFIQIRYKNNAVGLGFDRLKDNQWTETESNYNELLKNLNNSTEAEAASVKPVDSSKSLEEISKNSRARVHYKKFTKGKDVHKYSEKDLANILGKRTLNESDKVKNAERTSTEIESKVSSIPESSHIVNTGISVTDYFKRKLNKKKDENTEVVDKIKKSKKSNKQSMDEKIETELIETKVEKRLKRKRKLLNEESNKEEATEVIAANTLAVEDFDKKSHGGANAVYNPNVIQVTSHVAKKMAKMSVHNFTSANIGNVVGYGMAENVKIRVIQSKIGDNSLITDKYSIYSMDKVIKAKVNPRKILTKIKRTKKSIQVI